MTKNKVVRNFGENRRELFQDFLSENKFPQNFCPPNICDPNFCPPNIYDKSTPVSMEGYVSMLENVFLQLAVGITMSQFRWTFVLTGMKVENIFAYFTFFIFSSSLTMMHLCITLYTYWSPLFRGLNPANQS